MGTAATLRSGQIRTTLREGALAHRGTVAVHAVRRSNGGPARWAVVAGRKVGGAVQRNRAKRRLRGVMTHLPLPSDVDLVLVARQPVLTASAAKVAADVRIAVQSAVQAAQEQVR